MTQIKVPAVLAAIRAQLGLTQEQLAERLEVSFATVNRWEGGSNAPQKAVLGAILRLAAEASVGEDGRIDSEASAPAASRRRGRRTGGKDASSTKPMEQMLWDAACSIRGEKDAPKFKDYLLPLLFIKRLSDVFDDELARLAEQFGDRDTALALVEEEAAGTTEPGQRLVRLYIPPEARWGVVSGRVPFDWPADRRPRT